MQSSKNKKPYVIYLAEVIYKNIADIKKNNSDISNIDAIEGFIRTKVYEEISSGKFHDTWFKYLENNKFIDKNSGEKIPDETLKLLKIQKDATIKQLIKNSEPYTLATDASAMKLRNVLLISYGECVKAMSFGAKKQGNLKSSYLILLTS